MVIVAQKRQKRYKSVFNRQKWSFCLKYIEQKASVKWKKEQ